MANITIDWKDGPMLIVPFSSFKETTVYNHTFSKNGVYNVTSTLRNPLGVVVNSALINVINPVVNFRCTLEPPNTWNGNLMTIKTFTDSGDNVILELTPGTGDIVPNKTLTSFLFFTITQLNK